jgi:E3 ubiquitin-protein ligase ZNF598
MAVICSTGPMAEAGFKGHPSCRFCRKPVYGDNEIFMHMQQTHEQCFLCRRARPDKYVYYRDYAELEGEQKRSSHPHPDVILVLSVDVMQPSETGVQEVSNRPCSSSRIDIQRFHCAGHFRNEHFACDHPHCLEARFVVFANEQELKQHRLREHNEQLSRNERRAALQIPVNLTVRAEQDTRC